jgi:hypothetical protein
MPRTTNSSLPSLSPTRPRICHHQPPFHRTLTIGARECCWAGPIRAKYSIRGGTA